MTRFQYFFFGFDDSKLVNFVELIQLKNSKIKFTFSLRVHSVRKWTIVMTLANERVCYLRQRLTDYFA